MDSFNNSCNTSSLFVLNGTLCNNQNYIEYSFYLSFSKATYIYLFPIISVFSFITNLICCITFYFILSSKVSVSSSVHKYSSQMYLYLLTKSLCDVISAFFVAFIPVHACRSCQISSSYISQIWFNWFYLYIAGVLFLSSGFLEVAATLDCALSIENKIKWFHKRTSFILITFFIFLFCFIFEIFNLFLYSITKKEIISLNNYKNESTFVYSSETTNFYNIYGFDFRLADCIFRDFLVVLLLFIINLYILLLLRQIRKKRQEQNLNKTNKKISKNEKKAVSRKVTMIKVLGFIFFLGHLPLIITWTHKKITCNRAESLDWLFFEDISNILHLLSYSIRIFVYFFFNTHFKSILIDKIILFKAKTISKLIKKVDFFHSNK
jgi:hypothetical protein